MRTGSFFTCAVIAASLLAAGGPASAQQQVQLPPAAVSQAAPQHIMPAPAPAPASALVQQPAVPVNAQPPAAVPQSQALPMAQPVVPSPQGTATAPQQTAQTASPPHPIPNVKKPKVKPHSWDDVPVETEGPKPWYINVYNMVLHVETGEDPQKTLRAPFTKIGDMNMPTAAAMGLTYYADADVDNAMTLATPHRDQDQISNWVTAKLSDILSTSDLNWTEHVKMASILMSKEALESYVGYMQSSGIVARLRGNHLMLRAFVADNPLLLNQGVVDGRYRWLFEVHTTLGDLPDGLKDYEAAKVTAENSNGAHVTIRVQIGRVADDTQLSDDDDADSGNRIRASDEDKSSEQVENSEGLIVETFEVRKSEFQSQ